MAPGEEEIDQAKPKYLEEHLLATPPIALGQATKEIVRMAGIAQEAVQNSTTAFITGGKKLFEQIEKTKEEESMVSTYDTIVTVIRDILRMEGKEKVTDPEIVKAFEDELVTSGKIPAKFKRSLDSVVQAKKDYDSKKLTKTDVGRVKKDSRELIRFLVEYMQRKRGRELDRAKIKVKYGNKYGEITLLGKNAYVIADIDSPDKQIQKAPINNDGSIGHLTKSSPEEFEGSLVKIRIPDRVFIHEAVFESLKKIFGKHVEILMRT